MNRHVMAVALCLALQPVVALGAESQAGVKQRNNNQSSEVQRGQGVSKQLAKSCLPMQGNPNDDGSPEANKQGGARNDCEPATRRRATADAARLVHTFADGTKLYADPKKNGIHKYSAIDQRGRALKVLVVEAPRGVMPGYGDSIERGKGRAERERDRQRANFEKAIQNAVYGNWDKCITKWMDEDGTLYWDDYTCKL